MKHKQTELEAKQPHDYSHIETKLLTSKLRLPIDQGA